MSLHSMSGVAGEDLTVSRVVRATTTTEGQLAFLMADSSAVEPVGITDEGSQVAPTEGAAVTVAVTSGRAARIDGRGHTKLCEVGTGGVTAGGRVKVGAANGVVRGLTGAESGGEWTVGIARETRAAGELAHIYIDPQQISRPVS